MKFKSYSIEDLKNNEIEHIIDTTIMMTYNPSIARIFSKEINKENKRIIRKFVNKLQKINSKEAYNKLIKNTIKETKKKNKGITVGQAQKGINVFAKVFVDWMDGLKLYKKRKLNRKLKGWLHCPLDSKVMGYIRNKKNGRFYECYKKILKESKYKNLPYNLKDITNIKQYNYWQEIIKCIYSKKPVLVDTIWFLERLKERNK